MHKLLLSAALLTTALSATAQSTVFGLELGKELTIPECSRDRLGHYEIMPKAMCFKRVFDEKSKVPVLNGSIEAELPSGTGPEFIKGSTVLLSLKDGKLEGMGLQTHGLATEDLVLTALNEKFGTPAELKKETVRNGFGATYAGTVATWSKPNLSVFYESVHGNVKTGFVRIETDNARDARLKYFEEQAKARAKL